MSMFSYSALAVVIAVATGSSAAAETGKMDVYPRNDANSGATVETRDRTVTTQDAQGQVQAGTTVRTAGTNGFQPTPTNPNEPRPETPYGDNQRTAQASDVQGQRYEARRVSADRQQTQDGPTVCEALVKKLIKANEGEIELAKMAQDKSDNKQIKELTKTLIKDHKALNETLNQMSKSDDKSDKSKSNKQNWQSDKSSDQVAVVPEMLCEIGDDACDNALKMTKDMLKEKKGSDFDMAFLGQQCVCHTMTIAELKSIQDNGPQELRSFAEKAVNKTEQHLDTIKKLMSKMEKDKSNKS